MTIEKENNNKLFEEYYPNGQLSYRYWSKEIQDIIKPEHTYEVFYSTFFGNRWEPNFHSNLKGNFKSQIKFLSQIGFQELANDDEIIFDRSLKDYYTRQNCESYFDNNRLKFKYAVKDVEGQRLDTRIETFELFYKDCQPKFRFSYKINELEVISGRYEVFYGNGQMKEKGGFSSSKDSFERFSKDGQLTEYYNNETFYKYHENGKLHYRITLEGSRKHGPYELYDKTGALIEKGAYKYDEMNDGSCEWNFEDRQLYRRCFYKNGLLEGSFEEFHPNGQLYRRCFYKNGILEGIFEEYLLFGEPSIKRNYVNGKNQDNKDRNQYMGFD